MANYQGQYVFRKSDKTMLMWTEEGELSPDFTVIPPPTADHEWSGESWVLSAQKQEEMKAEHQKQVWEKIKQKRYENSLGGVHIERVGKWFQTGEEEKTKYLGLDKVIDKVGDIDWKCADNSFVKLNRALLDEIFLRMVMTENADHINAEKHRLAMLEADKPLEYDFSSGWSPIYQPKGEQ
ncbi:DUF4376 domain-containing protein [[Haemophilus] felis]|nr:DUF4376 domain-containing protein [[Haemophilus] felis]HEH9663737.1 DUF4376 domain-containing protein [Pasteurella multocida]HEH9669028.1 DUF4376 domain-containing protein [Pasteurella multocida]HEH9696383.1 DUF4376 domain-containing protein [Pasteurella multocida]HEH9727330.1 DUF4376 domain-containing protein [Pasteurella multocida]